MQLGRVQTTASTDPIAAALEDCGQAANFGPSLDAAGRPASSSDQSTVRPSRASSRARRRRAGDTTRAVVTVHSLTGPITPETLAMTQTLVTAVAGPAIANAVTHQAAVRRGDELAAAAHRIDADTAYAHLSRPSQSTNTKLHDLATDILTKATR